MFGKPTSRGVPGPQVSDSSSGEPELRIVLVGKAGAGKSATGNTILGEEKFDSRFEFEPVTKTCRREVRAEPWKGRRVVVIDTPAVFDGHAKDPQKSREIQQCLSLAKPDPFALVFVIQVGHFTKEDAETLKQVEKTFGKRAMNNLIVLFTSKEDLARRSLEQRIQQSENTVLRDLLKKCQNRCCVFNNKARGAEWAAQAEELLSKIGKMMPENVGGSFPERHPCEPKGKVARGDSHGAKMETTTPAGGRRVSDSSSGEPELRIVLVGKAGAGKSATGNTILGEEKFDSRFEFEPVTKTCRREVRAEPWKGRRVVVIDTPAVFDGHAKDPQKSREIQQCLSLAKPDPFALVFVIQVGHFTKEDAETLKQVEKTFGKRAMNNLIVLFTSKEDLARRSLEQRIQQSENTVLRDLLKKCQNRCCVFNNKARGAEWAAQAEELLSKIGKMMPENVGGSFPERHPCEPKGKVARGDSHGAKMETTTPAGGRRVSDSSSGEPELRIVLVGKAGAGKSATGNSILGEEKFDSRFEFEPVTKTCRREVRAEPWKGRRVVVIDTPAVFDGHAKDPQKSREIQQCLSLAKPDPFALVFVIRVSRFTKEDAETLKQVEKTFGKGAMEKMIVLFTCKEELAPRSLEEFIQLSDNKTFQALVTKCKDRCCAFNNKAGGAEQAAQAEELLSKILRMMSENVGYSFAEKHPCEPKGKVARQDLHGAKIETGEPAEGRRAPEIPSRSPDKPELCILLVGKTGGGKSATGNTILGEEKFESRVESHPVTKTCSKEVRAKDWKGKQVAVIDTSAVFEESQSSGEIQNCLCLAGPGPYTLVFVTQVGRFTQEDVMAVKQVETIFGEEAMKNMIVLFTRKEDLGNRSLQQFTEQSDNAALRELVRKCENRCCAFDNKAKGAERAVQGEMLLAMLEKLVQPTENPRSLEPLPKQTGGKAAREPVPEDAMETDDSARGQEAPEIPSRSPDKPELCILLVGKTGGGKSATGNTILGEEKFESRVESHPVTKTCSKEVRAKDWKGKQVAVIDTSDVFEEPQSSGEIQNCLCLAGPGPYTLVFVTQVGRFTQEDVMAVKQVETIFGEEAMKNMIVLFTRKEDLGNRSLQQFTEQSDNAALRELVRKCENRCCAFDNKAKGAERAVQGEMLLAMLEKLVQPTENPRSLEPLPKQTGGKAARGPVPEDAMETDDSARGQEAPEIPSRSPDKPELCILLVGKTGGGKSATGNTILGEEKFESRLEPHPVTKTCSKEVRAKDWKGKQVAVIDTSDVFEEPQSSGEIQNCLCLAGPGPYTLVFVTQVGRFTQEDVMAVKQVETIFGEEAMKNMIVLFTRKEDLGNRSLQQFTEQSDNAALRELVRKCENRCCAFDNKAKGAERAVQGEMLLAMLEKLVQPTENPRSLEPLPKQTGGKAAREPVPEDAMETDDSARGQEGKDLQDRQ